MVEVYFKATPNPQAMKFVVTKQIASKQAQFFNRSECVASPLAGKLFGFPWLKSVFIGPNFVTLTKHEWVEWKLLTSPLCKLIGEHIEQGEGVLLEAPLPSAGAGAEPQVPSVMPQGAGPSGEDSVKTTGEARACGSGASIEQQVQQVLMHEVRPALQADGGDLKFERLEGSQLYIRLQGACIGCPSAELTLKSGIENHMRQRFPQITEVIAVP